MSVSTTRYLALTYLNVNCCSLHHGPQTTLTGQNGRFPPPAGSTLHRELVESRSGGQPEPTKRKSSLTRPAHSVQNFLAFFRVAERGLLSWRRTEFATSTLRFRAARVSKRSH